MRTFISLYKLLKFKGKKGYQYELNIECDYNSTYTNEQS